MVLIISSGKHHCNHILIQHGTMLSLKGRDIIHQFSDKRVPTWRLFHYLLTCIHHDGIVHNIDAVGYMICVTPEFFVCVLFIC
jgi:hypothetical protein